MQDETRYWELFLTPSKHWGLGRDLRQQGACPMPDPSAIVGDIHSSSAEDCAVRGGAAHKSTGILDAPASVYLLSFARLAHTREIL